MKFIEVEEEYVRETVAVLELAEKHIAMLTDALEKIADPRKRDHSEPDAYTQLGCVMNIANEALKKVREDESRVLLIQGTRPDF